MARVILLGDPSKEMGSLAEPECRRIVAALELARRMRVPLEWFALSAGAKIAMDSGTENMDWIALVLRRIIEFTQEGGEINVVVDGINVGAQPYWNAEATMLMHTRGILVMTETGAMVLTGKRALDFSGGVSADDNLGIGGYERVMGPNGQAQYYADDLAGACRILLRHYEHTYVAPGERFPRRAADQRPRRPRRRSSRRTRAASASPPSATSSPTRRTRAARSPSTSARCSRAPSTRITRRSSAGSGSATPRSRWCGTRTSAAGRCACSASSRGRCRASAWWPPTAPSSAPRARSSRWRRRRSPAPSTRASGNRPVVVLANLSGFDGSPESMRELQLEYGAEIGRAVVNFRGPIVFCVVSRYHGGAFVVFSARLNDGSRWRRSRAATHR